MTTRLSIVIHPDGAAFADDTGTVDLYAAATEVARILHGLADTLVGAGIGGPDVNLATIGQTAPGTLSLRDHNGNHVGLFDVGYTTDPPITLG